MPTMRSYWRLPGPGFVTKGEEGFGVDRGRHVPTPDGAHTRGRRQDRRRDGLRAACTEAIRQLRVPFWYLVGKAVPSADAPQLIVIIGGDEATRSFDPAAAYPIWSGGHVLRHQAASQSYRASDVWRAACASLRI
jgi:hypothetical protein